MLQEKIEKPAIDQRKLGLIVDMVAPLVRELDQQLELRRKAPDGSNNQIRAQERIDELESDIAFYARKDLDISGAALAAATRSAKTPHLKRTATINAEALDKAETRLDVANVEMRAAQDALNAAYAKARDARRELRLAEAEHALIASGCETL